MSESPWLSPEAVAELTDAKRPSVQCRRLAEMGVPFSTSYSGRPLVPLAYAVKPDPKPRRKRGPDWSALNGEAA